MLFKNSNKKVRRNLKLLLVFSFELPPPSGTPSYPRVGVIFLFFNSFHKLLLIIQANLCTPL